MLQLELRKKTVLQKISQLQSSSSPESSLDSATEVPFDPSLAIDRDSELGVGMPLISPLTPEQKENVSSS
jgi:hypothetical protein